MELFAHQKNLIQQSPKYWLLAWSCGSGKSCTALKLIEQNCKSCLIVCPKSLKENWQREINKWIENKTIEFKIVTKEEFKKFLPNLIEEKREGLIGDELHNHLGIKSQLFKATIQYLKKVKPKCLYGLTATPWLSSPWNVYCLESIFGKKPNYAKYRYSYFFDQRMGQRIIPMVKKGIEKEMAAIIKRLGNTVRKEECQDLPTQTWLEENFSLTTEQKQAEKELLNNPRSSAHIVYWSAKLRIGGGTTKDELGNVSFLKNEKTERIKQFAKEHGRFVVVCRHRSELEMLKEILGDRAEILDGRTVERQSLIDKMNASKDGILLIQAAVSEGYNLINYDLMIFYSNSFSWKDRSQMEGRCTRVDSISKKTTYIDFIMDNEIDKAVIECLRRKQNFDLEIFKK